MSIYKINTLTLSFPNGATVQQCEKIASHAQKIVLAGISEGGMATTNKYGLNVDNVTFADDHMHYVYGYNRDKT